MKTVLLFTLSLLHIQLSTAQQSSLVSALTPDFIQAQFAGKIGLAAAGIGYNLAKDKIQLSLLNGYTPASIAGRKVNTIAIKGSYSIAKISLKKLSFVPYAGLGVNFETCGNGFYTQLPDRYSDGYYLLSAVHATGYAGARLQVPVGKKIGQRLEFYGETGTLDTYVYYYLKNSQSRFTEIFSGALGISYHFGNK